jgi:hypothetical protein
MKICGGDKNVAMQARMPALRSADLQVCDAGIPGGGTVAEQGVILIRLPFFRQPNNKRGKNGKAVKFRHCPATVSDRHPALPATA